MRAAHCPPYPLGLPVGPEGNHGPAPRLRGGDQQFVSIGLPPLLHGVPPNQALVFSGEWPRLCPRTDQNVA